MIRIRNLRKICRMGDVEVRGLDGIDLEIRKGEFLGIMGASGSGKTPLPRMLGTLTGYERTIFSLYKRGNIFRDYALLPDLAVNENVCPSAMLRKDRTPCCEILRKIGLFERRAPPPGTLGWQAAASLDRPGDPEQAGPPVC